jgi:hypothetical protein
MTELQNKVFELAKQKLSKESWYKGVCMDNFPTDSQIIQFGTNAAADEVWFETAYWDSTIIGNY